MVCVAFSAFTSEALCVSENFPAPWTVTTRSKDESELQNIVVTRHARANGLLHVNHLKAFMVL